MRVSTLITGSLSLISVQAATISKDARCGVAFGGATCLGSTYGSCCSQYNFCGSSSSYCATSKGCQSGFGTCTGQTTGPSASQSTGQSTGSGLIKSTDGKCGGQSGQTCSNSVFGNCCSQYGYCGASSDYCASSKGCQSKYGSCDNASSMPSNTAVSKPAVQSSSPSTTGASTGTTSVAHSVSTNGRCGAGFGEQTCMGSTYGDCCSKYSFCGSTDAYCGVKSCQKGYGNCNAGSSSSSVASLTSMSSSVPMSSSMSSSMSGTDSSSSSSSASASVSVFSTVTDSATSTSLSSDLSGSSATSSVVLSTSSAALSQSFSAAIQTPSATVSGAVLSSSTSSTRTASASSCPSILTAEPEFNQGSSGWAYASTQNLYNFSFPTTGSYDGSEYFAATRVASTSTTTPSFYIRQTIKNHIVATFDVSLYIRVKSTAASTASVVVTIDSQAVGTTQTVSNSQGWIKLSFGSVQLAATSHNFVVTVQEPTGSDDQEVDLDSIIVVAEPGSGCVLA